MTEQSDKTLDEHKEEKSISIIVNGRIKVVTEKKLSFAELIVLAYDVPPGGQNMVFTVTYRRGEGSKPEGILNEGESINLKDGMIFNVTATDKS